MKSRLIRLGIFVFAGLMFAIVFVLPIGNRLAELARIQEQTTKTLEEIYHGVECISLEMIQNEVPSQYYLPDPVHRVYLGKAIVVYKRGSFAWGYLGKIAIYRFADSKCLKTWLLDDPGPAGHSPP